MNELFDKLIIRLVFALFICGILLVYKHAHTVLYPSSRQQMFKRFYPSKNSADTLHMFSRLIGIGILFSEFNFFMSHGFLLALIDFLIQAILVCFIYLLSIYIIESIVLFNFEYNDEIVRRKSYPYAIVSFAHSIGLAFILKVVLSTSRESIPALLFLWLFTMVIIGFAAKTFPTLSKLNFNRMLVQKEMALAISYLGFIWGWTLIISSSLDHELTDFLWYSINVILKVLLSIIILPVFKRSLVIIFKIQDDLDLEEIQGTAGKNLSSVEFGYGVYEGASFLTCCLLTTVITEQIDFGTFYPVF